MKHEKYAEIKQLSAAVNQQNGKKAKIENWSNSKTKTICFNQLVALILKMQKKLKKVDFFKDFLQRNL